MVASRTAEAENKFQKKNYSAKIEVIKCPASPNAHQRNQKK